MACRAARSHREVQGRDSIGLQAHAGKTHYLLTTLPLFDEAKNEVTKVLLHGAWTRFILRQRKEHHRGGGLFKGGFPASNEKARIVPSVGGSDV